MKQLLRTTDPLLIVRATDLLASEGIMAFALDQHMSVLEGSIGILPRRLMVADRDLFMARVILRDNLIDHD
ncbi:DUF2007 domain-containing protein [Paracoccus sp. (in: a-proteobacteria)]|uniref:putative signal transducing protein n=1 Tax=Paracoccus sp. TaxID=267 RepID=UPI0035AE2F2E